MTALEVIDAYLVARRALGVHLEREGRYLRQFAREMGNASLSEISREAVARFLHGRNVPSAAWKVKRSSLAGLYRYAISRGIVTVSPLPDHPPKFSPPQTPDVYSPAEVPRLLDATAVLDHPASRLQAMTYRTLLLVLYGTGLRVGETIALRLCDVDLIGRLITVRSTKFYKTRVVPMGPRVGSRTVLQFTASHRADSVTGEQVRR